MMMKRNTLIVVLLVGWVVSVSGTDKFKDCPAQTSASQESGSNSRFAGGLNKCNDDVKSDTVDNGSETGNTKQDKGTDKAGDKASPGEKTKELGKSKDQTKAQSENDSEEEKEDANRPTAAEIAKQGFESIQNQTQSGLERVLENQKGVIGLMNDLAPEIGPVLNSEDEDFLIDP